MEQIKANEVRFNKGTKSGRNILRESLRNLGCGRSILCDKNGVVISGNNVYEAAQELGYKVRVVEAQPDELIVVKRNDVDAMEKTGLELAFVDNLVQEKNLKWNADVLLDMMKKVLSFDPRVWHGHSALVKDLRIEDFLQDGVEHVPEKVQKVLKMETQQLSLFDTLGMESSEEEIEEEEEEEVLEDTSEEKEEQPKENIPLGIADDDF
jgi:hypothetical protein